MTAGLEVTPETEPSRYDSMALLRTPRSVLSVLHVLSRCSEYRATLEGIRTALNMHDNSARRIVHEGVRCGMFTQTQIGLGRGAKSVVALTAKAHAFNRLLFGA